MACSTGTGVATWSVWAHTGSPGPPRLLPCSREVLGLVGGEGQLVVTTHHWCTKEYGTFRGTFWVCESLGSVACCLEDTVGNPGAKAGYSIAGYEEPASPCCEHSVHSPLHPPRTPCSLSQELTRGAWAALGFLSLQARGSRL